MLLQQAGYDALMTALARFSELDRDGSGLLSPKPFTAPGVSRECESPCSEQDNDTAETGNPAGAQVPYTLNIRIS